MRTIIKTALIAIALSGVWLLVSGIGWADVCFWKTGFIAFVAGGLSFILCPLGLIPIKPGSPIDTPVFFVPMMGACFVIWAILLQGFLNIRKKRTPKVGRNLAELQR